MSPNCPFIEVVQGWGVWRMESNMEVPNNKSQYILGAYNVSGTLLKHSHTLTHFILRRVALSAPYYR